MAEPISTGVLGTLGINGKLLIAQLVNFAVVLAVVWKWAYKPLLRVMDVREKKIELGLKNADEAARLRAEAAEQKAELLREARFESQKLIEAAREDAERERKDIQEKTQQELDRQLADARERLKREKETMLAAARRDVAELVLLATEKVSTATADAAHKKLVEQAIADLAER